MLFCIKGHHIGLSAPNPFPNQTKHQQTAVFLEIFRPPNLPPEEHPTAQTNPPPRRSTRSLLGSRQGIARLRALHEGDDGNEGPQSPGEPSGWAVGAFLGKKKKGLHKRKTSWEFGGVSFLGGFLYKCLRIFCLLIFLCKYVLLCTSKPLAAVPFLSHQQNTEASKKLASTVRLGLAKPTQKPFVDLAMGQNNLRYLFTRDYNHLFKRLLRITGVPGF